MELLMLIVGIVLLWKFGSALSGIATTARAKTEVFTEQVVAQVVVERSENFEAFKKETEGKTLYSHDEVMSHFKV
jgi:hypothetical protein